MLSGQVTLETHPVQDVQYSVHTKRGASYDDPKTLRVDYKIGWHKWKSEWVCFGHTGYARGKAVAWWKQRSRESVPATAEEAYYLLMEGIGIAEPKTITVRSVAGDEYDRITGYQLEPIPEFATSTDDEEVPF